MPRWKMNWDYVGDVTLTVYSLYLSHNRYKVKMMLGSNNGFKDIPYKQMQVSADSHIGAYNAAKLYLVNEINS